MKTLALASFAFLLALSGCAAPATPEPEEEIAAAGELRADPGTLPMQPLGFLLGEWEGSGEIQMGPRPEDWHTFEQRETVATRLDGVVVTIDGHGTSDGAVIHEAFAVLFHDAARGLRIRSFTRDGRTIESDVTVEKQTLVWGYEVPNQKVRFTIEVGADGAWVERGDRSADGGATWQSFLAMSLHRRG